MSNAVLKGNASGTGTVTLETPNTNSDRTISLPDATGTVMVSGNQPAFSAYLSTDQLPSNGTITKVTLNTKVFDTNSNFDATTNYRFTPTVAGYYQISAGILQNWNGTQFTVATTAIYKNGTEYRKTSWNTSSLYGVQTVSDLIYLNGSTDYVELYGFQNGGSTPKFSGGATVTFMVGSLVRTL